MRSVRCSESGDYQPQGSAIRLRLSRWAVAYNLLCTGDVLPSRWQCGRQSVLQVSSLACFKLKRTILFLRHSGCKRRPAAALAILSGAASPGPFFQGSVDSHRGL